MSKRHTACFASLLLIGGLGAASAQETSGQGASKPSTPAGTSRAGTAGEMQKGDAMKAGEMGGGSGNTGVPGRPRPQRATRTRIPGPRRHATADHPPFRPSREPLASASQPEAVLGLYPIFERIATKRSPVRRKNARHNKRLETPI